MRRARKVTIQLLSGKEMDVTNCESIIEIIKSETNYATQIYFTIRLPEKTLTDMFDNMPSHIKLEIEKDDHFFQLVENNNILLRIISIKPQYTNMLSFDEATTKDAPIIDVVFHTIPDKAIYDKAQVCISKENINSEGIINAVCESVPLKYLSPPEKKTFRQIFIPSMTRLQALSYVINVCGVYNTPVFYTHDIDGPYLYCLKDTNSKIENTLHYIDHAKFTPTHKDHLVHPVFPTSAYQSTYYELPKQWTSFLYTDTKLYEKKKTKLTEINVPSLGKVNEKMQQEIKNYCYIETNNNDSRKSEISTVLTNAYTLTAYLTKVGGLKNFRPGVCLKFKTDDSRYIKFNNNYVISYVNIVFATVKDAKVKIILHIKRYSI